MKSGTDSTPKTEILLGAYNGQRFIREQLDSILAQTDQDWKLIMSDDGSGDETPKILQEYSEKFPDKCIFYKSGKRFGSPKDHSIHLVEKSSAEIILLCDQDDFWYPHKLEMIHKKMNETERQWGKETPVLVFSDLVPVDAELNPLADSLAKYQSLYTDKFDYRSLLLQNVVSGNCLAVNRAAVDLAFEGVNPDDVLMIDWWLAVVTARFGKIIYIPEPLGVYRQHEGNQVGAKNVGSFGYILNNIRSLRGVKNNLKKKKWQAENFRKYFEDKLSPEDMEFLKELEKDRSGPVFYWKNRKLIHSRIRLAGMMVIG